MSCCIYILIHMYRLDLFGACISGNLWNYLHPLTRLFVFLSPHVASLYLLVFLGGALHTFGSSPAFQTSPNLEKDLEGPRCNVDDDWDWGKHPTPNFSGWWVISIQPDLQAALTFGYWDIQPDDGPGRHVDHLLQHYWVYGHDSRAPSLNWCGVFWLWSISSGWIIMTSLWPHWNDD